MLQDKNSVTNILASWRKKNRNSVRRHKLTAAVNKEPTSSMGPLLYFCKDLLICAEHNSLRWFCSAASNNLHVMLKPLNFWNIFLRLSLWSAAQRHQNSRRALLCSSTCCCPPLLQCATVALFNESGDQFQTESVVVFGTSPGSKLTALRWQ